MQNELDPQPVKSELYSELKEMLFEEPATASQRFLNFIIDIIVLSLIFAVFGIVAAMFGLFKGDENPSENILTESGTNPVLDFLFNNLILLAFYTFFEALTKGRTVGKIITRTKAVKIDGSTITPREALLRSLCRLVPFEIFSTFGGNPWHDKWTGTKVIKERR